MALRPCKSCKHQVDSSAKTCPSCGVSKPGQPIGETLLGLVILAVIIAVVITMCSGGSDDKTVAGDQREPASTWYTGGTLHQASAIEWQNAAQRDKLATSADWLANLWNGGQLKPAITSKLKSVEDLKPLAAELVKQLDAATEPEADTEQNRRMYANQKMDQIAVMTMAMMGWIGA